MGKRFWGLMEFYLEALASHGLAYILLPPQDPEAWERILPHLDGLLLPGEGDVDPDRHGEEPHPRLGEILPERDEHEIYLARYAAEKGLPTLGICRGIQVMNVALGGSLYQDLSQRSHLVVQGFPEVQPPSCPGPPGQAGGGKPPCPPLSPELPGKLLPPPGDQGAGPRPKTRGPGQ